MVAYAQLDPSLLLQPATSLYFIFFCSDVDGVLRRANATEFGLASGVFTKDINKVTNQRLNILIPPTDHAYERVH